MGDERARGGVTPLPPRTGAFVVACGVAGGLAVPPGAVATPTSVLACLLFGVVGLRLWRWSRLPSWEGPSGPTPVGGPGDVVWIGAGLLFGLAVLAVIRLLIEPVVPAAGARIVAAAELPLWRRAVVVYVAAVGEELVFRLILLSLVAGLAVRAFGADDGTSGPRLAWLANVVSALVFGAAHLQAWAAVGPLSLGRVMMVMTLNGLGGLLFGHLFLRRGIAPAMWAHAGADCAIQFVGPLTG